ncbi:hypothetical protein B0T16DRAFT_393640 [Cercophora newfieldiana]|uniref:Heterokaryon incompatibility domain-containing protein n=1 Tax=Cercophora newfieldiana TaxID=92897 RepID=A0AA40CLF7_9PEZI|nr:hypothetical protein B0T16DRAFT_393640 [Cercophora newfieldiana]
MSPDFAGHARKVFLVQKHNIRPLNPFTYIRTPHPPRCNNLGNYEGRAWLQSGSLELLLVDIGPRLNGLPCWVPDWSTAQERSWLPVDSYVYDLIGKSETATSPTVRISVCKRELTLRGVYKGKLTDQFGRFKRFDVEDKRNQEEEKGSPPEHTKLDPKSSLWLALSDIAQWISLARNGVAVSAAYDSIPKAILQVLSGGRSIAFDPDGDHDNKFESFNRWYRIMVETFQGHQNSPSSTDNFATAIIPVLSKDSAAIGYAVDCVNGLAGKRGLFFSRDGHFGTGPVDATVGDDIVALDGVGAPMILRKDPGGGSIVIGPAFVPGLSFMTEKENERERWEDVILI